MREIKFRGLNEKSGWVYGYIVKISTTDGEFMAIKETHYNVNNSKLNLIPMGIIQGTEGQFTGMYDKNGVEIYEGDIVKYYGDYGAEGIDSSFTQNFEVIYDEQLAAYEPFSELSYQVVDNEDFEVIGNIHENPELLEEK